MWTRVDGTRNRENRNDGVDRQMYPLAKLLRTPLCVCLSFFVYLPDWTSLGGSRVLTTVCVKKARTYVHRIARVVYTGSVTAGIPIECEHKRFSLKACMIERERDFRSNIKTYHTSRLTRLRKYANVTNNKSSSATAVALESLYLIFICGVGDRHTNIFCDLKVTHAAISYEVFQGRPWSRFSGVGLGGMRTMLAGAPKECNGRSSGGGRGPAHYRPRIDCCFVWKLDFMCIYIDR